MALGDLFLVESKKVLIWYPNKIRIQVKNTFLFALALLCLILLNLASCKKSSSNSGSGGQSLTATVNGQAFVSTGFIAANSASEQWMTIFGYKIAGGDTTAFLLYIGDTLAVGEPGPFTQGELAEYGPYEPLSAAPGLEYTGNNLAGPGNITVTAWDTTHHTISGNFYGTLYTYMFTDSVVVTNGKFENISYVDEP